VVPRNDTDKYGIVAVQADKSATSRVNSIVEKPKPAAAPSNLAVVGRYVLSPAIFAHLERVGQGAGGEIQLTDGIAALMKEEAVYAHRFTGKRYDCGSKLGYLQATVEFGLGHPQLGKDFGRYLTSLSRQTINSIAARGNDYVRIERRAGNGGGNNATAAGASHARTSGAGKSSGRRKGKAARQSQSA
jgi:dTDP-glucose pyrophosphorylase